MPPVSWAAPEQQAARCRLQVGSPALVLPGHSCQWGRSERGGLSSGAGCLAAWAAAGLLPDQAAGSGSYTAPWRPSQVEIVSNLQKNEHVQVHAFAVSSRLQGE